ncbi:hypothetical protein HMPREF9389_0317 [Streptococcus sanguinis SK355]|uniref:Uncharacterized protein n=1 Tax=Streptococcus sanguinis SK355 TaxID=888816 RepID=F3UNA9_STRSA|nr:hypothetical protein HMPREF9389_0317 [Streptococcus sanguinis SK355]
MFFKQINLLNICKNSVIAGLIGIFEKYGIIDIILVDGVEF